MAALSLADSLAASLVSLDPLVLLADSLAVAVFAVGSEFADALEAIVAWGSTVMEDFLPDRTVAGAGKPSSAGVSARGAIEAASIVGGTGVATEAAAIPKTLKTKELPQFSKNLYRNQIST